MEIMLKTCTIPPGKRQVNGYLEEKIILDLNTEIISRLRRVGLLKGVKRVFGSNIIETERPLSLRGIIPITDLLAFISGIIKMPKNNLKLTSFKISIRELIIVITAMVSWHTAEITTIMVRNLG
tara:strand:+ start:1316 stop:1687 length:372 start_codon:yes stop_codon:yes gene_type:complete